VALVLRLQPEVILGGHDDVVVPVGLQPPLDPVDDVVVLNFQFVDILLREEPETDRVAPFQRLDHSGTST